MFSRAVQIIKKVLCQLLLIHNNIYTFISGIMISLSVNILTSLCFEEGGVASCLQLFISAILLFISSALFMLIASRISKFQNYILIKNVKNPENREGIVQDAIKGKARGWCIIFFITALTTILGIIFLALSLIGGKS